MQRSDKQNGAAHLYFERLAEALNDAGYEMKAVLAVKSVDVPWSKDTVKEVLWRPIQQAMTGKKSTTMLSRGEVGRVYDVLDRHLSENFGVSVEFPHEDE
jgi:hypothetical protein